MNKYSNLKFFDSNSDELNLKYDSTTFSWEGVVYIPEVSVDLFETLTIYILEEVKGELGETKYIKPITPLLSGTNNTLLINFESGYDTSIESNGVNNDISMYTTTTVVNDDNIPELYIKHEESITKTRSPQSIVTGTSGIFDTVLSLVLNEPIQINIALRSKLETYHKRTLKIHEVDSNGVITHTIASIRIYGETIAEDERLETLISNIGMSLSPSDHFVFEDANLRESSPDWKLINRKRRELLLEAANIKPFIGTYKALLNAIKYFGYENITLKEYYLNINEHAENFGKLKAVAVPNQEIRGFLAAKSTMSGGAMPNSNLKKTSRFSLVYRLNNATGEYDQWDIPEVKEALDFSPDEVLIKLYGLKNRLQKTYVPMHAKIVDICGEGDYFSQFNINTWNNQQNIYTVNEGVMVGYKLFPDRGLYLEDLRKVSPLFTGIGQDFTQLTNIYDSDAGAQSWWKLGENDTYPKIIDHIGSNNATMKFMATGVDTTFAVDHPAAATILYVDDASTWLNTHNITYDGAIIEPVNLISWADTVVYFPKSWVTNGGNSYYTEAGGTAGSGGTTVPPVHVAGSSLIDGPTGVLWLHVVNGTANNDVVARSTPIGTHPKLAALVITDYTPQLTFTTTLNNGGAFLFGDTTCTLTSVTGLRPAGEITVEGGITIRYSGITAPTLTGCTTSITSGSVLDGTTTLLQRGFWEISTLSPGIATSVIKGAAVSNSSFSTDTQATTASTKSLSFDNKTTYVSVPNVNKNIRPENALTMSAWVKHDDWLVNAGPGYTSLESNQSIVWAHSAPGGFKLYYENGRITAVISVKDATASGFTNYVLMAGYNKFNATYTSSNGVPPSLDPHYYHVDKKDWHMITVTFDGRYLRLYIDGKPADDAGVTPNVGGEAVYDLGSYGNKIYYDTAEPIDLHIGSKAAWAATTTISSFQHWDGLIDDVSIWNTPLSAARIKELYGKITPSNTASLTDNPIDDITSFYTNYEDTNLSTYSESNIPVGCPIVLRADSLKDTFNDCEFTWEDGEDEGELTTTWDNWWYRNVYEIEWRLIGPTVNGLKYDKSFRGTINNFYEIAITLPYIGKYDVELSFYDLYNVRSVKFEKQAIEVKSKEIETYAITQVFVPKKDWNEYIEYDWSGVGSDWDTSNENEEEVEDFLGSYYLTLDRANYANSDSDWRKSTIIRHKDASSASGFSSSTGPYIWTNLINHTWNTGETMSWDTTYIGADINAAFSFDITDNQKVGLTLTYYVGSSTTLLTDTFTSSIAPTANTDLTNWDLIEDELNALLGDTTAVYTPVATSVTINNGAVSDCVTEIASPSTVAGTILYAKNASNYLANGVITYTNATPAVVSATCTHIENFTVQNFKDITVTHITVTNAYTTSSGANITLTGTLTAWPTAGTLIVGGETIIYSGIIGQILTVTSCTINTPTIASGTTCTSITGTVIDPTTTTCGVYTSTALGTVTMSGASMNVGAGWPHAGAVTMTTGATLRYTSRTATQLTVSYDSNITTKIASPSTTLVRAAAAADKYVFVLSAALWVPGTVTFTDTGASSQTVNIDSVVDKTGTDTSGVITNVIGPASFTSGVTTGTVNFTGGSMDAGTKWPQAGTVTIGTTVITYDSRTANTINAVSSTGANIVSATNCINATGLGWELEFEDPVVVGIANGAAITGQVLGVAAGTGCVSVIGNYEITVPAISVATIETDPLNGQSLGYASGGATLTLAGDLTAWPNTGTLEVGGYSIEYNDIAGQVLIAMSDTIGCSPVADATNITSFKEKEYPQLSKYTYNAVKVDTNNDGILDTCDWMLAVAKGADKMHDYNTIVVTPGTGTLIKYNKFESCNPTYDNVQLIKQHEIHNKLNHFTFSYDNSKVPGVAKQEWTLKNNSKNINDIYYNNRWLPFVFNESGDYTLDLIITDVNGNEMKTTKNILTIK